MLPHCNSLFRFRLNKKGMTKVEAPSCMHNQSSSDSEGWDGVGNLHDACNWQDLITRSINLKNLPYESSDTERKEVKWIGYGALRPVVVVAIWLR